MHVVVVLLGLPLFFFGGVAADSESPAQHVARGMQLFRANDIDGSLRHFDKAADLDPDIVPALWQRGISHYYAGKFADGVRQFEVHKTVNPHDVENAAWHFLCAARVDGVEKARKALIEIDTDRDRRVPMTEVYELYAGRGTVEDVIKAAKDSEQGTAQMYADLYLGLYYEVLDDRQRAKQYLRAAAAANLRGQYMHEVAKVHLLQRGWKKEQK